MFRAVLYSKVIGFLMLIFLTKPIYSQVSPEIQFGARGVMSFNVDHLSGTTTSAVNDFSDSGPLIGFRQKLYNNFRGQLVIGFQFPDANSDLGQLFFHQVFLKIEDKSNILKMGRSRVRTTLIEFPTLRDDDALHFTDVLNPFSSGENSEDNQYGNVFELTHIFGQRYWLRFHGEHFTETPQPPNISETDFSLNAIGLSFEYRVPPSQRWNRPVLNQLGISLNNFLTDQPGNFNVYEQALKNIIFSTIINLKPDPVHFLDLRYQIIYNLGFREVVKINKYSDLTRGRAFATFTSIRYLYRKLERPTTQLSFSLGYKIFPDIINTTHQFQIVANGFYRLGENFDVGLQLQYKQYNGDLKNIFGGNEARIQFAVIYSIDQVWNNQFDDRNSLLNLEHGYIP